MQIKYVIIWLILSLSAPYLLASRFACHQNALLDVDSPDSVAKDNAQQVRDTIREALVVITSDGMEHRYIADSCDNYFVETQDYGLVPKSESRVEIYRAADGDGIVTVRYDIHKGAKIRKEPDVRSRVVVRVKNRKGELPVVMRCLGLTEKSDADGYYWYFVEVDGKRGYVREDYVEWDAIDTY